MLTDIKLEVTPKKNEHPTMRRMYAITDITASVSDATWNENKPQASNGEYIPSQPRLNIKFVMKTYTKMTQL